jgi:type III secretion protein V
MGEGTIPRDTVLALAERRRLLAEGFSDVTEVEVPGVPGTACRLPADTRTALEGSGVETVDPPTQITLHLGQLLKTYAYEFVGIQETQQLLDRLERSHPTLVNEVVPKVVSLQTLSEVLQRLVEEGVSIRDLRRILGVLAEWGAIEKEPGALSERVRGALRRQISHSFTTDDNLLRVLLLDPMIEQAVRDSIQSDLHGSYLAMEPDLSRDIVDSVRGELEGHPADVILTTTEIRRHVRRLVEADLPGLPVLAYNELLPDVRVETVARVSVG